MTKTQKKLLLIDGSSLAFRAFYALYQQVDKFIAPDGTHTNAIYGFHTMLTNVLDTVQPSHVLVAFDAGKTTFRTQLYADYKGGRAKTPDEFREQFPFIREMIAARGMVWYELADYEADDIIGTLARQAEIANFDEIVVVSGDRDLTQLTTEKVTVEITLKGVGELETYTPSYMMAKLGLTTSQFIDLKALMGDKSDNIPGVTKIGEKTGIKLLKEYGSLDGIYEQIDTFKPSKMKENLIADKAQAYLSKQLATIDTSAPITVALEELVYQVADTQVLADFYDRMGFQKFKSELDMPQAQPQPLDLDFQVVEDPQAVEVHPDQFFYLELADDNYHKSDILAFAWGDSQQLYVSQNLDVLKALLLPLNTYDHKKNAVVMQRLGRSATQATFDSKLAKYLISTTEDNSLKTIADLYGQSVLPSDESVYGKGAKWTLPDRETLLMHVARKLHVLIETKDALVKELTDNDQLGLLEDMELPLAQVLAKMEYRGIKVEPSVLEAMAISNEIKLGQLSQAIYDLAGEEFNISSPKQLAMILFEKLQLPGGKKTKSGSYSTAIEVLEGLSHLPIVEKVLTYRQIAKLQSTYVKGLRAEISSDGKVHTRYIQDLTQTGRLSSVEPNLQNIPVRLEEGKKIRQAFVPESPDSLILSADYSQIELRVLAHISQDAHLIEAFNHGADIHTSTAMRVFEIERPELVTANDRRNAKAVNFGVVYGISDFGLAKNLGISRQAAKQYIDTYFDRYPGIKTYMTDIVEFAKAHGYVETLYHRRRKLPDIKAKNFAVRSFAERTAINSPIQGSAADILKVAMIHLDQALVDGGYKATMRLQVHDEIILEVPQDELEAVQALVNETMSKAIELAVPLLVDESAGKNWYEAK